MQAPENNRFFELVKKERDARDTTFGWLRASLLCVGSSLTALAVANSENITGISGELSRLAENSAFTGMCASIGSVAVTGFSAVRYWAISDLLQADQAKNFVALTTTDALRDLSENTDFIARLERPDDFTEDWE